MLFKISNDTLEPQRFEDLSTLGGKREKDLENMLAEHLFDILFADEPLMAIFQERAMQSEPDVVAMDAQGDLTLFELKLGQAERGALGQLFGYVDAVRTWDHDTIERKLKNYRAKRGEPMTGGLQEAHRDAFGLDVVLPKSSFNRHQRMVVVGSAADEELRGSITYWKTKGLDVDFMPYRVYKIGEEHYFEFFAKPYDHRVNPGDEKGVMFDTNKTYIPTSFADMVQGKKISAYGTVKHYAGFVNKGDIVFYSHRGAGIVAAARVTSSKPLANGPDELYHRVEFLTPEPTDFVNPEALSFAEVKQLLNKGFYWARTIKHPYLTPSESEVLLKALNERLS